MYKQVLCVLMMASLVIVGSNGTETVGAVRTIDVGCFLCRTIISHVKPLATPDLIDMIRRRFVLACDRIEDPGSAKQCREEVNQFVDKIEKLVDKDPNKICSELGMCQAFQLSEPPLITPFPSIKRQNVMSCLYDAIKLSFGESTVCKECKSAIRKTQDNLNRTIIFSTDNYVENMIGKICKTLHPINGSIYVLCHEKLSAYWEKAVNFILSQDPQALCSVIGICESPSGFITNHTCESCENIIDNSMILLNNEQKLSAIRQYIQEYCRYFASDEVKCNQGLVSMLYIYDKVISQLDKHEICVKYHMCKE